MCTSCESGKRRARATDRVAAALGRCICGHDSLMHGYQSDSACSHCVCRAFTHEDEARPHTR
jgi:hypothetical protein